MKAIHIAAPDPYAPPAPLARRPISQVMSKPPACVTASAKLETALLAMVGSGLRHLVVLDESGRCVGVLADRAIAAAWADGPDALSCRRVSSVLEPEPATVGVQASVIDAARLMCRAGVDAVAVVDAQGAAVGIVTGSDLVALLTR